MNAEWSHRIKVAEERPVCLHFVQVRIQFAQVLHGFAPGLLQEARTVLIISSSTSAGPSNQLKFARSFFEDRRVLFERQRDLTSIRGSVDPLGAGSGVLPYCCPVVLPLPGTVPFACAHADVRSSPDSSWRHMPVQ